MMDLATCATLACVWEASAPKPGNVYRGADFENVSFVDFLTSAAVLGPRIASAGEVGVGQAVLDAVRAIRRVTEQNTHLGSVLLMAPLAAVPQETSLRAGLTRVLQTLNARDTHRVYDAIRLAQPGGLGHSQSADVQQPAPEIPLCAAMQLAEDRDLVARQYTNNFEQVFWVAERIAASPLPLSQAIVHSFLELLAEFPDSLIARKCGQPLSEQVSQRAGFVLQSGQPGEAGYQQALADLDFWLRSDGHRRNPGTSADLIAAGLFVLLRQNRLDWPVRFY